MTVTDDGVRAAEELLQEVLRAFKVRRLYEEWEALASSLEAGSDPA